MPQASRRVGAWGAGIPSLLVEGSGFPRKLFVFFVESIF